MGKNETRNLIRQTFGGNRLIEKLSNGCNLGDNGEELGMAVKWKNKISEF